MSITKIVLTGGPCAGKTTALSTVEQKLSERTGKNHRRMRKDGKGSAAFFAQLLYDNRH